MDRLIVFLSFIILLFFKIALWLVMLIILILFSPIFIFINKVTFLKVMEELNENLK